MKELMKINYDDYYKFLVSAGIVGILLLFVVFIYLSYIKILIINFFSKG